MVLKVDTLGVVGKEQSDSLWHDLENFIGKMENGHGLEMSRTSTIGCISSKAIRIY